MTVVAELVRSGIVESRHHGSLVALAPDGAVLLRVGEPERPVLPRSTVKPLQAAALVRLGIGAAFRLDDRHLALAAASHSGDDEHLAVVADLLARAGLSAGDLRCPAEAPLGAAAARALAARGEEPGRAHHNCSGKHAAMLAACVAAGWPTEGYREADHPLQRHVTAAVEELTGERAAGVGVDGCGAPVLALRLAGLARAFGRIALAAPGSAEHAVAAAMRAHPRLVGGAGREVTRLMEAVPGLLAKDGAEGMFAAATRDGVAVALKVEDGAQRARVPVVVAALRALGVAGDEAALRRLEAPPVLGGGAPVGEIRAAPDLLGP